MASKFIESPEATNGANGDADISFWTPANTFGVSYDTVTTPKSGAGSWKVAGTNSVLQKNGVLADAGRRISFYFRDDTSLINQVIVAISTSAGTVFNVDYSSGILRLRDSAFTHTKTGSTPINPNTWYRITVSYVITSATNWTCKVYLNGNLEITATNADWSALTGSDRIKFFSTTSAQRNFQHIYIDDGTGLDDPGDIRTTAKRPVANGSANQFTTQIGSGGSGYGTGHAPQVNELPASATNGWQAPTTSGTKTEEYTLESASTGNVDMTGASIVDYVGWVLANTANAGSTPTTNIIVKNATTSISLTATNTLFSAFAASQVYPGGNTDIGMTHTGTGKASQLTECGIVFAYVPGSSETITADKWHPAINQPFFEVLGVVSYFIRSLFKRFA